MALKIRTNLGRRPLVRYDQLPEEARNEFDYLDAEAQMQPRFVLYKRTWYDTSDCDGPALDSMKAQGWDAYRSDSFYSGVVFRFFDPEGYAFDDEVIVGQYAFESDL